MRSSRNEKVNAASCNVLLISGVPGIGKTTVVQKVLHSLEDHTVAGFYTKEIRINRIRKGFELVTLDGDKFVMAHIDIDSPCRVSKYGVNVMAIDAAVEKTLSNERDAEIYIIDEIGKMECFSNIFVQEVSWLLESGKLFVATISLKGNGFISEVKNRDGVELWEITKQNRDAIPAKVREWIMKRTG